MRTVCWWVAALLMTAALEAQHVDLPEELQRFVPNRLLALELETADLNRDGREDYLLLVGDMPYTWDEKDEHRPEDTRARPLLVITRQEDGTLKLAARSDRVVLCRDCGGIFGDPFAGIQAETGRFTVQHYAGSSWRWTTSYTFGWSRRDQAWQLIRVESTSFHASDPEKVEKTVELPPRHYGLIELSEFDPEKYRGQGRK